jgi:hypothetical protein
VRPASQLEILSQAVQAMVEVERAQRAIEASQALITKSVEDLSTKLAHVAESRVLDHCPQNCEPITKIRVRMGAAYVIPPWVIDTVMRGLPLSPKVHGMVKNAHADANGAHYEVWAVSDITRVFARFIRECEMATEHFATHPDIKQRFRVKVGVLPVRVPVAVCAALGASFALSRGERIEVNGRSLMTALAVYMFSLALGATVEPALALGGLALLPAAVIQHIPRGSVILASTLLTNSRRYRLSPSDSRLRLSVGRMARMVTSEGIRLRAMQ